MRSWFPNSDQHHATSAKRGLTPPFLSQFIDSILSQKKPKNASEELLKCIQKLYYYASLNELLVLILYMSIYGL